MSGRQSDVAPGIPGLELANDQLRVTLLPGKGADVYSLVHRGAGVDVLFKSPWGLRAAGAWSGTSGSMGRWLEAYGGGWQLLLPNGGDECSQNGAVWGFHGEASLVPWQVIGCDGTRAELETVLFTAPLHVYREFVLDGNVLRLREVVTNSSEQEVEVMWSHHPAFGAPFLEAGCLLSAGCRSVVADDRAPGDLLEPGSRHDWPVVTTVAGDKLDLRRVPGPDDRREIFAYLSEFDEGFFAITNPRLRVGVGLRWPLHVFDKAWLWQEVHSGQGWPWFRRAYVVAVEPASTVPGQGMANVKAKGGRGMLLAPRQSQEVVIEAVVFEGSAPVAAIADGGAVRFAAA